MPHSEVRPRIRNTARRLRRDLTDAERLLWAQLRGHRLSNLHFRRQAPLGNFIVDFVAHEPKLIVELDGSQHNRDDNRLRDAKRDAWLLSQGYIVLRFWNNELFESLDVVKETIYERCMERLPVNHPLKSPPPNPPPLVGRA